MESKAASPFMKDHFALQSPAVQYPSQELLHLLFPFAMKGVKEVLEDVGLHEPVMGLLFPEFANKQCPEERLDVSGMGLSWGDNNVLALRNPLLLPHQALGMVLSATGVYMLAKALPSTDDSRTLSHWIYGCVWYCLMNVASVFAHNVFEPPTATWELFWSLDAMCTGIASAYLWFGAVSYLCTGRVTLNMSFPAISSYNLLGTAAMWRVAKRAFPWKHELMYIAPGLLAGVFLLFALLNMSKRNKKARTVIFLAIAFGFGGPLVAAVLDPHCCRFFGAMKLGMMHMFFGTEAIGVFFVAWAVSVSTHLEEKAARVVRVGEMKKLQ